MHTANVSIFSKMPQNHISCLPTKAWILAEIVDLNLFVDRKSMLHSCLAMWQQQQCLHTWRKLTQGWLVGHGLKQQYIHSRCWNIEVAVFWSLWHNCFIKILTVLQRSNSSTSLSVNKTGFIQRFQHYLEFLHNWLLCSSSHLSWIHGWLIPSQWKRQLWFI